MMRGQPQAALQTLEQACAIKQQIDDQQGWYNSRNQIAMTLLALGQTEQAEAIAQNLLHMLGEGGEPFFRGVILDTLAIGQLLRGDLRAARQSLDRIAAMPIAQSNNLLRMAWERRSVLLMLLTEGAEHARTVFSHSLPLAGNGEIALDHACLDALITQAAGDELAAQRQWQQLAQRAASNGYEYYRIVAEAQLQAPSHVSLQQRVLQMHQPFAPNCWYQPALAQAVND